MNVKIDTKEKFTVITPNDSHISANMTGEWKNMLLGYLEKDVPHLILNLQNVVEIEPEIAKTLAEMQEKFMEYNASFITCEIQKNVEELLKEHELMELLNITPTESEAWDIAQMEEIERELMKDDENTW